MNPGFEDQAAGLRRLLHKAPPQVLSVVSCGPHAVQWLADQARERAATKRSVVAFDELDCCGNLADALGVVSRFDLLQVVEQRVPLEVARKDAGHGLALFSAAQLSRALPRADRLFASRLSETCRRLQFGADLWLVHSRPGVGNGLSPLAMAAHRMMVIVEGNARSVTEAYALIKQVQRGPWPQIDLAVVAGAGEAVDERLIGNLVEMVQHKTVLALRRVRGVEASLAAAAIAAGRRDERFLDRVLGIAQRPSMALSV